MQVRNVIRVAEYEKLYYDDEKPFKKKHWEVLCAYLENEGRNENRRIDYFRILNKGIQFTNYVGVIQAGNLTIEVLPKIDRKSAVAPNVNLDDLKYSDPERATNVGQWHKVLLDMLKECRLLRVNQVNTAYLNLKSNTILDIYLELFIAEVERLLHEGLIKKYCLRDGNRTALRGRLLFHKQIADNCVHAERFYVCFSDYNVDNMFNQILYSTICFIPSLSNNGNLLDRVNRLKLNFPDVSVVKPGASAFARLSFDRKTARYREALLISKMLWLNFRPDISGGIDNVIAILFDMNRLWEEFIYRRLKKEEAGFDVIVSRQETKSFWESVDFETVRNVRPDIIIKRNDTQEVIVLDTKWKLIDDFLPSVRDLKQMYVYNLFWKCKRSILLYPAMDGNFGAGEYFDFNNVNNKFTECRIQTVNVLDDESKLCKSIGAKLMDTFFL